MIYPVVADLDAKGVPVAVPCRLLARLRELPAASQPDADVQCVVKLTSR